MGEYSVDYGANEDVQRWSKQLFREALKRTLLMKWASPSASMPIQVQTDLSRAAGSRVKVHLKVQSTGKGRLGDAELEGHEEGMTTHQDVVKIDQLRHAFKDAGRMTRQRVNWDTRAELKDTAADWIAERLDVSGFNHLCGYTTEADLRFTGVQAVSAPTTSFWASGSDDESLGSSHIITPAMIDKAINKAQIMSPLIRPVSIDGEDHYICVLHPNQVRDLRVSSGDWYDVMKSSLQGGRISDNPIFTGALGAWNNCIFYQSSRVTNGVNSTSGVAVTDAKRAVFMGAQALALCFGQGYDVGRFDWVEDSFDYGNKYAVAVGLIFGMKKLVFNSVDFGAIVLHTYGADPT